MVHEVVTACLDVLDVRDGEEVQPRLRTNGDVFPNVARDDTPHLVKAHCHIVETHWLDDKTSGIDLVALNGILSEARHKYDLRCGVAAPHLGGSIHAIHPGQVDVHEHHVHVIGSVEKRLGRPIMHACCLYVAIVPVASELLFEQALLTLVILNACSPDHVPQPPRTDYPMREQRANGRPYPKPPSREPNPP